MKGHLAPLALFILLVALAACSNPVPTPTTDTPTSVTADAPENAVPASGGTPASISSSTPALPAVASPMPVPIAAPEVAPLHRSPSADRVWVRDRVAAVAKLYDITPEGKDALAELDVRWIRDQPGFFGSYGYRSWAGVGEARPVGVMHELSHSYWGLFAVSGSPELAWDPPKGADISPAMESYHRDVLKFMAQPPDYYEPLRSRLRDLPELSSANPAPLFHTIEADAIYTTAGDLELMPPILRKYWDQFLLPGPFYSWYAALGWYGALSPLDKGLANNYIGLEHFDQIEYDYLRNRGPAQLGEGVVELLRQEERQRLRDFVQQFDLILNATDHQDDFKFWRRYLQDKIELHEEYPGLVASLGSPKAEQMAAALDTFIDIKATDVAGQVTLVIRGLGQEPFLVHFLPALDNRTLLELFSLKAKLPKGALLKGTEDFVRSLEKFTPHINSILEATRDDLGKGADRLSSYLNTVDFQEREELQLFFEVLEGSDSGGAKKAVAALDDSMLRRLLKTIPAKLRGLLTPRRFVEFLDITLRSPIPELTQGIKDMIEHPSGNFRIDEPFLDEMNRVVAARSRHAPGETLMGIATSPFPLERFIERHPSASVDLLAHDLDITVKLVGDSDAIMFPPARFIYRLIYVEPEFAATVVKRLDRRAKHGLVKRLDRRAKHGLVIEALAHFAYDADRLQALQTLPISLKRDGQFLSKLMEDMGGQWLSDRIGQAVGVYRQRAKDEEVPGDFLAAYEKTLKGAVSTLQDGKLRRELREVIDRAFR